MSTEEHVLEQWTEFTMIVSGPLPDPEDDEIEQEEEEENRRKSRVFPKRPFPISGDNASQLQTQ